jgi:hypothetical protein
MRVNIQYQLPEDEFELKVALKAKDLVFACDEFYQELRRITKYAEDDVLPEVLAERERIKDLYNEIVGPSRDELS